MLCRAWGCGAFEMYGPNPSIRPVWNYVFAALVVLSRSQGMLARPLHACEVTVIWMRVAGRVAATPCGPAANYSTCCRVEYLRCAVRLALAWRAIGGVPCHGLVLSYRRLVWRMCAPPFAATRVSRLAEPAPGFGGDPNSVRRSPIDLKLRRAVPPPPVPTSCAGFCPPL